MVELAVGSGGEEDRYTIGDRKDGGVLITGNNHRRLLYGVGKFLRSSSYEDGDANAAFIPGTWRGSSAPVQPYRAVYWWTHIGPRWRNAELENIRIDVEDMGLWGVNVIAGCFPVQGGYGGVPGYSGYADPKLAGLLLRMETMMKTARELGLKTCLFIAPTTAYSTAPKSIRATPSKNHYKGGIIPYCEHIYTDADMAMMAQLSWAPDRPADEILREYTRFEFSGAHVDSVIEAIRLNEGGKTTGAAQILKSVEPKLTSFQRDTWR